MFTLSWLFDTLERAMGLPSMQNADGEELIFHDVRFPLASGVTQKDIAARVSNLPGLSQENAKFWNWLEQKPKHGARKRTGTSLERSEEHTSELQSLMPIPYAVLCMNKHKTKNYTTSNDTNVEYTS